MRGASLPERRRAEFARLSEIDDAVDAFLDRGEFAGLAPDVQELVAVAVKALLGAVRRFDGHELTLVLQWLPGTSVTVGYRDGSPSLELSWRPPETTIGLPEPATTAAPAAPGDLVLPSPRPPAPPAGPATVRLPRIDPDPVGESGADGHRPPPSRRALREDVAAEIAALREVRTRSGAVRRDPDAGPG